MQRRCAAERIVVYASGETVTKIIIWAICVVRVKKSKIPCRLGQDFFLPSTGRTGVGATFQPIGQPDGIAMQASELAERILAESEAAWRRLPSRYQTPGGAWTRADPHIVAHELRCVAGRHRRFLEWGSGIGTHCLIADALGFEAHGIEIDAVLVASARRLAGQLNARSVFVEGSFVPNGVALPPPHDDVDELLSDGGVDGSAALAKELQARGEPALVVGDMGAETLAANYDVIYAYPAPQHVDWFADLFRSVARVGAVFWCYTETAGILTATKVSAHAITRLRPA